MRIATGLTGLWGALLLGAFPALAEPPAAGSPSAPITEGGQGSTWVVGNGDSWFSMRSRICPVEALQQANPGLQERSLRVGDKILAPFVPVALLQAAEQARDAARQEKDEALTQAQARIEAAAAAEMQLATRTAELEAARAEIDALARNESSAQTLRAVLGAVLLALAGGLTFAAATLYAAHRSAALREERLKQVESEYAHLRRSVTDLDVQLQRRMLKLLSWHETRVLTEQEVEEATAPVLEMARKLKERHAS